MTYIGKIDLDLLRRLNNPTTGYTFISTKDLGRGLVAEFRDNCPLIDTNGDYIKIIRLDRKSLLARIASMEERGADTTEERLALKAIS